MPARSRAVLAIIVIAQPDAKPTFGVDSNLDSLDQAIKAKNGAKFAAAYQGLTAACDACHTRAGEPQIKIIEPLPNGSGAFSDQDFAAGNSPK